MSFWKSLFGPSKEEVWQQLSRDIGAQFVDGGWWRQSKVQAHVKDWIVTLDTYTVSTGKSSTTYTRMRAPYVNREGLRFAVYRRGFFTDIGKWLGMVQDIEVGHPAFDRDFVIQGNDPVKMRALFANDRIRELIQTQPSLYFHVTDDEGWFGAKFPQGVDELRFQVVGVIKDLQRLRNLFDLFTETLNQLYQMQSAGKEDVLLLMEALLSPGGQIESEVVLWDGNPPRHRAAEELGRLKDAQAVAPLLNVLTDPDNVLRAKAIWALGEIGDTHAVPFLIPLLGDVSEHSAAGAALRKLSEGELVEAFSQTLLGNKSKLTTLKGQFRDKVIQGLIKSLDGSDPFTIAHAAWALGELGAMEALPHLKSKGGLFSGSSEGVKEACARAIAKLETLAALPRPAEAASPDTTTLPRPSTQPMTGTETLPHPADDGGEP
jgi:hypothetical protein